MFGDNLKKIRETNNLSQAVLAKQLNVAQQTVGSWEINRTSPSPEMLVKIAEFLNVSVDILLGQEENKKSPSQDELIEMDLTDEEEVLIKALRALSPEERKIVLRAAGISEENIY